MKLTKKNQKIQKKSKKSSIRQLTNKERFLIALLAIVILFWISFNFIIEPQIIKITELETEIAEYNLAVEENNRMIKDSDLIIEERNTILLEKESIEKGFFKSLSQPEIIYILNELLLESGIEMESITFTNPLVEVLNEKEVKKMDILMPFEGDFESLNEIIKEIEKEPRKMIIDSIDISNSLDTEIVGNINLAIYSLSGLVDVAKDNIPIEVTTDNKFNPFLPYEGYIDPNTVVEESTTDEVDEPSISSEDVSENTEEIKPEDKEEYDAYKAVKGDNISYITKRTYGSENYVDKILKLNNMKRSSILPIGKELKLIKEEGDTSK